MYTMSRLRIKLTFMKSQISDGQVQAATGSPSAYTGGMPRPTASLSGLVAAGFVGVVAML